MPEAEIIVPKSACDRLIVRIAAMQELYAVLEVMNAPYDLLKIVEDWGETLDDDAALENLRALDQDVSIIAEVFGQFE